MTIALVSPKLSLRRTIIIAAMPLVMGASAIGCSSSWWQNFISDPAAQVQTFEAGVQVVLSQAQVAWTIVQPFLPAASAATITQQYENAVYAVNGALQVLNDAVTAAIAAQQPTPDFSGLMTAVTNAITTVIGIVQQYVGNAPVVVDGGAAAPAAPAKVPTAVPALTAAQAGLASLQHQIHAPAAAHH